MQIIFKLRRKSRGFGYEIPTYLRIEDVVLYKDSRLGGNDRKEDQ
jgi:hypothetical protein